jgi:hypothetical protein
MINQQIKFIKARKLRNMYIEFQKATAGMDDGQKNVMTDQLVMSLVHNLIHGAHEHATKHHEHLEEQSRHSDEADKHIKGLHQTVDKLVNHFGKHEITDPSQVPHIQHLIEQHPVIPKILKKIMNHEITISEGVQEILDNIKGEKEHDKFDISSSLYQKSLFLGTTVPMSVMNQYSSNALSAFRPVPPFLINTHMCPDEMFVKMIMKLKDKTNEPIVRPMAPIDQSHSQLSKDAGIEEGFIPGPNDTDRPGENTPIQKSIIVLPYFERKLRMKHG